MKIKKLNSFDHKTYILGVQFGLGQLESVHVQPDFKPNWAG